jgi:hypothetical protein
MKPLFYVWTFLLIGTTVTSLKASDGDWQQWTDLAWNQNLGNGLDAQLRGELRFGNDMSRFSYYEIEPSLNWRYSPRWDFFLGYERDEQLRPSEEISHVPNIGATLKVPLKNWFFSNRSRIDFSIPEEERSFATIYRDQILAQYNGKWGARDWNAFISDEVFLNLSRTEWSENRASIGVNITFLPHWIGQIYFMRQDVRTLSGWEWHPILGLQFQTQF